MVHLVFTLAVDKATTHPVPVRAKRRGNLMANTNTTNPYMYPLGSQARKPSPFCLPHSCCNYSANNITSFVLQRVPFHLIRSNKRRAGRPQNGSIQNPCKPAFPRQVLNPAGQRSCCRSFSLVEDSLALTITHAPYSITALNSSFGRSIHFWAL